MQTTKINSGLLRKEPLVHLTYKSVLLIFIFCVLSQLSVSAQTEVPDSQKIKAIVQDTSLSIEQKLVRLALEGPAYYAMLHQNKINEYQLKKAKSSWMNILSLSANYNDQTFTKNPQGYAVYPKYFFGFTLPLGTIFSKTEVKSAKEQIELGKNNEEQLVRNITADILTKYHQYKSYDDRIIIQNQIADDAQALFLQVETKFKAGDKSVTVESYTLASKSANEELTNKANLQLQKDLLEIEIERIIGTSLKSVLGK